MGLQRTSFRAVMWLVAGCWLAAGPGGVVVRAAVACRHAAMQMPGEGMAGHAPMPQGGPCFCSQMAGGFDQALLSTAVPTLEPVAAWIVTPVVAVMSQTRFAARVSPPLDLETPPPIVA